MQVQSWWVGGWVDGSEVIHEIDWETVASVHCSFKWLSSLAELMESDYFLKNWATHGLF